MNTVRDKISHKHLRTHSAMQWREREREREREKERVKITDAKRVRPPFTSGNLAVRLSSVSSVTIVR